MNKLSLKWGTLKSWNLVGNDEAIGLLKEYAELGMSNSAMLQENTLQHKEILCRLIDSLDCDTVYLDWDGIDVSKEDAKKYIMDYDN